MNYICPCFQKKKTFIENAIVGSGGFFLYVLTAEKILVINDLGPQYQDLCHMGGWGGGGMLPLCSRKSTSAAPKISDAACMGC